MGTWWVWCVLLLVAPVASAQINRLPYPDTTRGSFFGVSVAIDQDRVLVGASGEDACGENSGAAYLYERVDSTDQWQEIARLTASDCEAGDFFGRAVALSGDRALIAASERFFATEASNAAYVFERDPASGQWRQTARLEAEPYREEGAFATSVAIQGDRALITTSGDPSGGRYGGAAYLFERSPRSGRWQRVARLTGSGGLARGIFGASGDLDGDRVAIASSRYFDYKPGSVYLFERDAATRAWREVQRIDDIDEFFISLDLDGDRLLIGESRGGHRRSGEAALFTRTSSGKWQQTYTFRPSMPYDQGAFGSLVSLQGGRALIAGYDEQLGLDFNVDRVVYAYEENRQTGTWEQRRVLDVGAVAFGSAIDHEHEVAVVGQAAENQAGAAYIVRLP